MNISCPRLIEVALPVREISAESVRDKSLRHGHISTLHLWWARRPLAASRAVVFASLVPDPDDPRCPEEFRRAVEQHLKTHVPAEIKYYRRGREVLMDEDPYRPYDGVPDTLRNRLLMFIAKWSPEALDFERGKRPKPPKPKELLDDCSLVKWETSDPENLKGRKVLHIARELVRISHVGQASSLSKNDRQDACPTCFVSFDPKAMVEGHTRHLPHWRQKNATYFITFRLADAIPHKKIREWEDARKAWLSRNPKPHTPEQRKEYHEKFTNKFQKWLDAGYGSCVLCNIEVAQIVESALRYFDGERYKLIAYVIMPNHVHVLITPKPQYELSNIVHSWKSYTATKINRFLGKKGKLWQDEYFDHIVRNPEYLARFVEYIRDNPKKAGLSSGFIVGVIDEQEESVTVSDKQVRQPFVEQASSLSKNDIQDACATTNDRQDACPTVLDPFAGGGAIPLEAGRLGCKPIANDYNPVAYLILRATCEFPQKYGKPGKRTVVVEEFDKTAERDVEVSNVLAHDVEKWARWILDRAKEKIGHLYPCLPAGRRQAPKKWESGKYYVYVLHCKDGSLYKGHTDNMPRRLREHSEGLVDWTSSRRPVYLVYWEAFDTRGEAVEREKYLKSDSGRKWLAKKLGEPEKVVGYLWARTAPCSNPSCRGEMPLLRSLLVCNKKDKKVTLTMDVDKEHKTVRFGIARGKEITRTEGTMQNRGNVRCPYCGQVTPVADLRAAGLAGKMGERMVAVIVEGKNGKDYRPVEEVDLAAFREALAMDVERPQEKVYDNIVGIPGTCIISPALYYGMPRWGDLFNPRQLVAMQTFVQTLHEALDKMKEELIDAEYRKAVGIYLGLWVSRNAMRMTSMGRLDVTRETVQTPFDKQAIPMKWDYVESNPFSDVTGGVKGQLVWMLHYLTHESEARISATVFNTDGAQLTSADQSIDVVVTDPPYFDSIAYSDLSDFFYVWLKRALGEVIPEVLITPLTPKSDEATALKHRHDGSIEAADKHFTTKLAEVLAEAKRLTKPDGIITVMFAHQSTKAWAALINALFEAGLTINATWPIDTELKNRSVALGSSALESSITVACRPRITGSAASFKEVRKEIEWAVQKAVQRFWSYGFRGADLIVACYGPAVGVFGKYERVEKADGTPVGIPEFLDLARQAALDAIAGEFRGDNLSTLYYVWANLYGVSEQAWDDARLVVQIGGLPAGQTGLPDRQAGEAENAMEVARRHGIFVVDGSRCRLALLADRAERRGLGLDQNPPLIDALHRSMLLWKEEKRQDLVLYLTERDLLEDLPDGQAGGPFWKLAQALFEVLPRDLEDWKLVNALLAERPTLLMEARSKMVKGPQRELL